MTNPVRTQWFPVFHHCVFASCNIVLVLLTCCLLLVIVTTLGPESSLPAGLETLLLRYCAVPARDLSCLCSRLLPQCLFQTNISPLTQLYWKLAFCQCSPHLQAGVYGWAGPLQMFPFSTCCIRNHRTPYRTLLPSITVRCPSLLPKEVLHKLQCYITSSVNPFLTRFLPLNLDSRSLRYGSQFLPL